MRIPIWPGVRLSVWEKQNPEAVQVRLPYAQPEQPVRRVLSVPGWMLLLVRYDRKDHSPPPAADPAKSHVVQQLTKELHRRKTHLDTVEPEDGISGGGLSDLRRALGAGEVLGLQGALGIALGAPVAGGCADRRALEHYRAWVSQYASEWNRCRCELCTALVAGGAR